MGHYLKIKIMAQNETEIQKIINDFDTPQTRQLLNDLGPDNFKKKFLSIATNLNLSNVDDPELQPVFINNIDKIIDAIKN